MLRNSSKGRKKKNVLIDQRNSVYFLYHKEKTLTVRRKHTTMPPISPTHTQKKVIPCRCSFCVCSYGKVGVPRAILPLLILSYLPFPPPPSGQKVGVGASPPFSMRCVHWAMLPRGGRGIETGLCQRDGPCSL